MQQKVVSTMKICLDDELRELTMDDYRGLAGHEKIRVMLDRDTRFFDHSGHPIEKIDALRELRTLG